MSGPVSGLHIQYTTMIVRLVEIERLWDMFGEWERLDIRLSTVGSHNREKQCVCEIGDLDTYINKTCLVKLGL